MHVEVEDATPPGGTPWSGPRALLHAAKVAALERALAAPTRGSPASGASSRRTRADAQAVERRRQARGV